MGGKGPWLRIALIGGLIGLWFLLDVSGWIERSRDEERARAEKGEKLYRDACKEAGLDCGNE